MREAEEDAEQVFELFEELGEKVDFPIPKKMRGTNRNTDSVYQTWRDAAKVKRQHMKDQKTKR